MGRERTVAARRCRRTRSAASARRNPSISRTLATREFKLPIARLRLLDRIAVHDEENLCVQPVQFGIVEELVALLRGLRDAAFERAQGLVVAPGLPEARGERRYDPAPDRCQLVQRLLDLRDARRALARFDPRLASKNPPARPVL